MRQYFAWDKELNEYKWFETKSNLLGRPEAKEKV